MVDFAALRNKPARFADKRAEAIWLFRSYIREEIAAGRHPGLVLVDLRDTLNSIINHMLIEHPVNGIRYWEHPHADGPGKNEWFATTPKMDPVMSEFKEAGLLDEWIELDRGTWLARQGLADSVHDAI